MFFVTMPERGSQQQKPKTFLEGCLKMKMVRDILLYYDILLFVLKCCSLFFIIFLKGNAGDSLAIHNQMKFSTKDRDNDASGGNCATKYKGAWWYQNCHYSNLNGRYLGPGQNDYTGVNWYHWKSSHYSMKKTEMKIRPNQF